MSRGVDECEISNTIEYLAPCWSWERGIASEIGWIGRQVIKGWKTLLRRPQRGQYGQQGLGWNTYLLRFNLEGLSYRIPGFVVPPGAFEP